MLNVRVSSFGQRHAHNAASMISFFQPVWAPAAGSAGGRVVRPGPLPNRGLRDHARGPHSSWSPLPSPSFRPPPACPPRHGDRGRGPAAIFHAPPGARRPEGGLVDLLRKSIARATCRRGSRFGRQAASSNPPSAGEFGGFTAQVGPGHPDLTARWSWPFRCYPPRARRRILLLSTGGGPAGIRRRWRPRGGRGVPAELPACWPGRRPTTSPSNPFRAPVP